MCLEAPGAWSRFGEQAVRRSPWRPERRKSRAHRTRTGPAHGPDARSQRAPGRRYGSRTTLAEEAETASHLRDEFLTTVAHEIRNPLSAIPGWTRSSRRRDNATAHRTGPRAWHRPSPGGAARGDCVCGQSGRRARCDVYRSSTGGSGSITPHTAGCLPDRPDGRGRIPGMSQTEQAQVRLARYCVSSGTGSWRGPH